MTTYFLSDIHLDETRPAIMERFLHFLQTSALQAQAVYLLGDIFETWIGDDDDLPLHNTIQTALAALTSTGVSVYFMHGNRDFLVGERFAQTTGCTLLPEAVVIDLYGTPTLLLHGDTLCTADVEYQAFRKQARSPLYQHAFLQNPLLERRAIAAHIRATSKEKGSLKADYIMDVTEDEVIAQMERHQAKRLIHGHTHRPGRHQHKLHNNEQVERIVLGAWEDTSLILKCTAEEQALIMVE